MDLRSRVSSRKFQRGALWTSGLVLVAGVVMALIVFVGNTGKSLETPKSNEPAQLFQRERPVPLDVEARRVAGRFILTAVARKNLEESYEITHPDLRQGLSLAEWKTGEIPVTPYPTTDVATFKVDESYPDRVVLEVALLPEQGSKTRPQVFYIGLKKVGKGKAGRWLVDYWVPRGTIAIPDARGDG